VFTHFAQTSTDVAQILSDFARICTKSNVLGVRLHPLYHRLLHQCFALPFIILRQDLQNLTLAKEKEPMNYRMRQGQLASLNVLLITTFYFD